MTTDTKKPTSGLLTIVKSGAKDVTSPSTGGGLAKLAGVNTPATQKPTSSSLAAIAAKAAERAEWSDTT